VSFSASRCTAAIDWVRFVILASLPVEFDVVHPGYSANLAEMDVCESLAVQYCPDPRMTCLFFDILTIICNLRWPGDDNWAKVLPTTKGSPD
jgi:hypothetical protein